MSRKQTTEAPRSVSPKNARHLDAKFIGWQESTGGESFPLFNIVNSSHTLFNSTVSEDTLYKHRLRIPRTPSPFNDSPEPPWRNIGTELSNLATAREALQASGLDYTVVKKPLKDMLILERAPLMNEKWATVRTDNGEMLGIVGDDYVPVQNRDAFAFLDTLVGKNEAIYDSIGMFGRGEYIWLLAKLPGYIKIHGKDIVGKYLLITNCHDGSSSIKMKITPIRVVCNNSLSAALKGGGEISIRHTATAAEGVQQAISVLGFSNYLFDQLDVIFKRMSLKKITNQQLLEYVETLVPQNKVKNYALVRNRILELHETGHGAEMSRGTLWGAFNCASEYSDHGYEGNSAKRLQSSWFGEGEKFKMKAFHLIERLL